MSFAHVLEGHTVDAYVIHTHVLPFGSFRSDLQCIVSDIDSIHVCNHGQFSLNPRWVPRKQNFTADFFR